MAQPVTAQATLQDATLAVTHIKLNIAVTESPQPTILDRSATIQQSAKRKKTSNQRRQPPMKNRRTNYVFPAFWGNCGRKSIHNRESHHQLKRNLNHSVQQDTNRGLATMSKGRCNSKT